MKKQYVLCFISYFTFSFSTKSQVECQFGVLHNEVLQQTYFNKIKLASGWNPANENCALQILWAYL